MKTTSQKATEALDLLPENMREPVVAYLIEQAEKFRLLKDSVAEGIQDIQAGKISEWSVEDFLKNARVSK